MGSSLDFITWGLYYLGIFIKAGNGGIIAEFHPRSLAPKDFDSFSKEREVRMDSATHTLIWFPARCGDRSRQCLQCNCEMAFLVWASHGHGLEDAEL